MSPQARTGIVAFSVVGGLFLLTGLGVGAILLAQSGKPAGSGSALFDHKPRADKEGMEWTIDELRAYLAKYDLDIAYGAETTVRDRVITVSGASYGRLVVISQYPDRQTAHDVAGASHSLAWGRFLMRFGPTEQEKIRGLLNP
jgi:hypothetical protein